MVISNDKLRVQYGNLKMKEAFTKADNVLATAAKCITDVINSRGHIIVDFADVCTVMKNGGVAILGKAEVEGENRAQRAIEEALNSPLLNDNDIKGAKWILLNINSAEGDFECSMDELETISNILRERTGEHSDVIMGSGYDDTLGEKIGITLIATGFEGKDPFKKDDVKKEEIPTTEKIVMTLASEEKANVIAENENTTTAEADDHFVLSLTEEAPVSFSFDVEENLEAIDAATNIDTFDESENIVAVEDAAEFANLMVEAAETVEVLNLAPSLVIEESLVSNVFVETPEEEFSEDKLLEEELLEDVVFHLDMDTQPETPTYNFTSATTEFVLSKPTNIYVDSVEENATAFDARVTADAFDAAVKADAFNVPQEEVYETVHEQEAPIVEAVVPTENFESSFRVVLEEEPTMQLVVREQDFENTNGQVKATTSKNFEMPLDDSEEQRRKVRERIQKLRNLSFNIGNGNDPSAEFDEVPAYVRRNMDLFGNTLASVENFYSKYTVDQDDNNQTQISTINSFLDGKKPD